MPLSRSYGLLHTELEDEEDEDDEEEEEEDEEEDLAMVVGLGGLYAGELRNLRRSVTRQYLTRPQLLPNPRYGTPWQTLLASQNDRAFITTMG